MSLPWFKFTPAAWRGDQALRAVSLAARGLWMECLCIMHEARPYGHLLLNGAAISDDTLASMSGVSVDEVRRLIAELRQAGAFSVTAKGVIYSRRMTRDHERAQKGRKAAKKRWLQTPDLEHQFGEPNGSANGIPTAKNTEVRIPPKAPQGGRRRVKGSEHFLRKAAGLDDGNERSEEGFGGDRRDAGGVSVLAVEHH